jgi:SAM-dependent methyltransferase
MNSDDLMASLEQALRPESGAFRAPRCRRYLDFVFGSIPLAGASVLDIGGGEGLFSFYAVARGAVSVVCLEPEGHGGTAEMRAAFLRNQDGLDPQRRIEWQPRTLQTMPADGRRFDVILLHNSVNHLDENACIELARSDAARRAYAGVFARIHALAAPRAALILCDCSSRNLYAGLGVRNPFAVSIEWHKHQPPALWIDRLAAAGFSRPRLTWTFCPRLGATAGGWVAWFLDSHFRLEMRRQP